MNLYHFANLSSGPAIWPGGFSGAVRALGPTALIQIGERVKQTVPEATGIILDDPWGKWPDPTMPPGSATQSMLQQRALAQAAGLQNIVSIPRLIEARRELKDMGLDLKMKLGYPPANISPDSFAEMVLALAASGVGAWVDGNAIREFVHAWQQDQATSMGIPWWGIEAFAPVESTLNSEAYPAFGTVAAWVNDGQARENPTTLLWRGSGVPNDRKAEWAVNGCNQLGFDLAANLDPWVGDAQGVADLQALLAAIRAIPPGTP